MPVLVATSVTLSATSLSFTSLGETTQLSATVNDQNGVKRNYATVTWDTSRAAVATVSSAGLVKPVSSGTATITATSGSASITATVTVADFLLAANGVTVMCTDADVGDTGTVGGVTYTKRSKAQITTGNAQTTCTSDLTDMYGKFRDITSFNKDIGSWDVSSVTDMTYMFVHALSFNQDISSWDVSSVTDMTYMFRSATAFNQDLSGWCVSNIVSAPTSFDTGATSWVLARPVWGTCPM